jgi:riboflavin kinase/FMN adenylyltransferase
MPDCYNKIALTFEKPPKAVMTGEALSLMTFEQKAQEMAKLGVTAVKLKFEEISHLSAEEFLNKIYSEFSPEYISCGFNYHFGNGGKGNTRILRDFCEENGITLNICDPVRLDGVTVSSSKIRQLIADGEIAKANAFLNSPFCYENKVIHGDGRGKTLGFPTLNQRYPEDLIPLKFGVYKTKIDIDGEIYMGITDVGRRPTYPVDYIISETFIKDYSGDLYDKNIKITPVEFIREEKKFESLKELKQQIEKDIRR